MNYTLNEASKMRQMNHDEKFNGNFSKGRFSILCNAIAQGKKSNKKGYSVTGLKV
jgi:hypothetical protein